MIDQQQHLLLHHHQHCHQWIPPLGNNNTLLNKKEIRKSTTKTTNFEINLNKESSSSPQFTIVAEFIPPKMNVSITENEENSKKREEVDTKRKTMAEIEGKNK